MTPEFLKELINLTVRDPREAARRILAINLPNNIIILMFAAVSIVSAIIGFVVLLASVGVEGQIFSPISSALFVALMSIVMAGAITYCGRLFGGTARFRDIFVLGIWSQSIQIGLSLISIIVVVVSTGLSQLVDWISFGFTYWLLVNFTTVAHGFKSRGIVAVGIFGMTFVIVLAFSIIAISTGLMPVPVGA